MDDEARKKAKQARADKKAYALANLKLEWGSDKEVWKALAKKWNVLLPNAQQPNTELKYIKRAIDKIGKEIGIDGGELLLMYVDVCGCRSLKQLASLNPTFPAFVEVGSVS